MTRPSELLPCPFCGNGYGKRVGRCVTCTACGASGPEALNRRDAFDALAAWNTRASIPPADVVPSAEHWRKAVIEWSTTTGIDPGIEWIEWRAQQLAKEEKET